MWASGKGREEKGRDVGKVVNNTSSFPAVGWCGHVLCLCVVGACRSLN